MLVKNVFAHPLEMRDGRRIALHAPSETCDESALRNIKETRLGSTRVCGSSFNGNSFGIGYKEKCLQK